ncbi:MAG: epoxyqueuosine reductase QueH [Lachnospiraceae bacterium]|nr:epoxyqueuosine reductase QueH [Lachnospiraceae bacterium]
MSDILNQDKKQDQHQKNSRDGVAPNTQTGNKRNYQKELDRLIEGIPAGSVPTLMLHSCCAPCSSYCLEYLCKFFSITVFYYNPNISSSEEYKRRVAEQKRLIEAYNSEGRGHRISIIEGDYHPEKFFEISKGLEYCKEGGERCFKCFDMRLKATAMEADKGGFDYFATTLTISPLKNADKINEIGFSIAEHSNAKWLPSDFKKKDGYKRSVELSKEYDLYRQDYCGCAFSKRDRLENECP